MVHKAGEVANSLLTEGSNVLTYSTGQMQRCEHMRVRVNRLASACEFARKCKWMCSRVRVNLRASVSQGTREYKWMWICLRVISFTFERSY